MRRTFQRKNRASEPTRKKAWTTHILCSFSGSCGWKKNAQTHDRWVGAYLLRPEKNVEKKSQVFRVTCQKPNGQKLRQKNKIAQPKRNIQKNGHKKWIYMYRNLLRAQVLRRQREKSPNSQKRPSGSRSISIFPSKTITISLLRRPTDHSVFLEQEQCH